MKHFKFNIGNSKQLFIALTGAFSTWAATGFQKDAAHLSYVLLGFITGGLASHEMIENPNVMPPSHIMTPYVNNIKDSGSLPSTTYTPEGADIKKIIKINSGLLK